MFSSTMSTLEYTTSNQNVQQERITRTNHNHKGEDIVQYNPKRWGELLEPSKIWTLHHTVRHRLQDERCCFRRIIICLVHSDECLQEPYHHDHEERKENQRLLHHHLQHYQHRPKESKGIQIQQQPHPEHRRAECEEIITQFIKLSTPAIIIADRVSQSYQSCHKGHCQQRIEGAIENIPKTDIKPPYFPEFGNFVKDEPSCHDVQYPFHDIQVPSRVDRVDRARVQS